VIRSLLWKDLRLSAPAIMTAALLFATTYISIFTLTASLTPGVFPWLAAAVIGVHYCQWSMVVAAALLGGSAFASEREDESYRFFHSLPVRRWDATISKLVVVLLAFECLWLLLAFITHATVPYAALGHRDRLPGAASPSAIAAFSFLVLGASWCWSAWLAKPILAAVNGLMTSTLALFCVYGMVNLATDTEIGFESIAPWSWPLGIIGFVVGAKGYISDSTDVRARTGRIGTASWGGESGVGWSSAKSSFRALISKDRCLAQTVLLAGGVTLVLPYAYPLSILWQGGSALEALARASTQTLWLSCIVFAIWGGYIVSVERASRTDLFLRSLPVRMSTIVGSRLLLSYVPALAIFLTNVALMIALHTLTFRQSPVDDPVSGLYEMTWSILIFQSNSLLFAMPTFGMPLVCFGVAWFGSIVLNRPFLGIGLGAATPGLVLVIWLSFESLVGSALRPMQAGILFFVIGLLASLLLLGLGYRKLNRSDLT